VSGAHDAMAAATSQGRGLAPYIYDVIKERLLNGEWTAGQSITVETLRAELGVSKQPVMVALRRLAVDGLVEVVPQVGCRVLRYRPEEVSDFFRMFASLEAEAAAIASERRTVPQIEELMLVNGSIGAAAQLSNPKERARQYRALNRRFHAIVLEMAQSAVVSRTSNRMWDLSDLLINAASVAHPVAGEVRERHADHERIIVALKAQDSTATRDEMRAHILRNITMLQVASEEPHTD
jgi:DNA-binding GntR family transcriptional regulator